MIWETRREEEEEEGLLTALGEAESCRGGRVGGSTSLSSSRLDRASV